MLFRNNTFGTFRGDTFVREITTNDYQLQKGDKFHIVVMRNAYEKNYLHEQIIEIQEQTNKVNFEILPCETDKLPIGELLLEIELTTTSGIVVTNQYTLEVKADGIYERN